MPLLTWKDEFSVHHPLLDGQHKKLIQLINELYSAAQTADHDEVVVRILDELIRYTDTHFDEEERIISEAGYPDIAAHRSQHQVLVKRLSEFSGRYHGGEKAIRTELLHFVASEWLLKHILLNDSKYASYLKPA